MRRHLSSVLVVLACALAIGTAAWLQAQTVKEPDTVLMKRATVGVVTFEHKKHAHEYKVACATCHHPDRPEVPRKAPNQACSTCHTTKPAAPMKTSNRDAFHDALARKGVCVDCHLDLNAKAKKEVAPVRCATCHIKGKD
jgi:ABC-type nickel/cobalt efflux system permease component RcnA